VTLIGLVWIVAGYIVSALYSPSLSPEGVPAWVSVFAGVCLFVYQTFDNMDGKQARRIKASSALGFLFDHGCDALNAGLMSPVMLATCVGAGGPERIGYAFALWLTTVVPFFFNTWEEYHIGEFVLAEINGPDEGILVVVGVFFATAAFGQEVWWDWATFGSKVAPIPGLVDFLHSTVGLHHPLDLVILLGLTAVPVTIVLQIRNAVRHVEKNGTPPGADDGGQTAAAAALGRALPIVFISACASLTFALLPELFLAHPRAVFTLFGLAFTQVTSNLMIAHVCQVKFRPSLVALLASLALPLTALVLRLVDANANLDADAFPRLVLRLVLAAATAAAAADTVAFLYDAAVTLADALNIFVFVVGPRRADVAATTTATSTSPTSRSTTPKRAATSGP
jgi:CDP-alcohol phosphatidyltransferase